MVKPFMKSSRFGAAAYLLNVGVVRTKGCQGGGESYGVQSANHFFDIIIENLSI